eukprot:Gb_22773 [translate_table: standard]
MAMAQPLMSEKKKTVSFLGQILVFQDAIKSTNGLPKTREAGRNVNANYSLPGEVRTLCKQNRLNEALQLLRVMGQHVNPSIYDYVLQACIGKKALPEGKLVHAHIIQTGIKCQEEIFLGNGVVNMYAKCGTLVDARRAWDRMPKRNLVSWNMLIAAHVRHGYAEEALTLFYQMQRTDIQPDQFTFPTVLTACANLAALEQGKEIHELIVRSGFQSDVFVGNALVDMYAKCGNVENARHVFEKMPQRDVVSWNAMIAGYVQYGHIDVALRLFRKMPARDVVSWTAMIAASARHGYCEDALTLFYQMRRTGIQPNQFTFASVLPACANLAALEQGKEIHENIVKSGLQSDIFVNNALVDMYAKCGSIENAHNVFDKMTQRDVVSWNVMIVGYAIHGCGKEALLLFQQMQQSVANPDHVTFLGVLSACCHAGLVHEGWQYFNCMSQCYNVTPAMEHYGCMIDLLGRSGHLDEAHDLIQKMPIKPDTVVWGSLLAACKIHTNIELGECAAEHLFELDCQSVTPYVLLSIIYATAGRRDGVEKVRKLMKDRRVKKRPGCSWIVVNKRVHAFVAGDASHTQMHQIYAELERLSGQMKAAGYVPYMGFL